MQSYGLNVWANGRGLFFLWLRSFYSNVWPFCYSSDSFTFFLTNCVHTISKKQKTAHPIIMKFSDFDNNKMNLIENLNFWGWWPYFRFWDIDFLGFSEGRFVHKCTDKLNKYYFQNFWDGRQEIVNLLKGIRICLEQKSPKLGRTQKMIKKKSVVILHGLI